ncbi:MAG: dihydropteroate synthase [Candidatus Hydrogenedentota bacterium]
MMGVLNVTPDSFFDGGRFLEADTARRHAQRLTQAGADIVDIGGESSRPGAEAVEPEEERNRILPVIEALEESGPPLSVDTYRAETARRALEAGARMINDITALRGDPAMAEVLASAGCECVLMHMQGAPKSMQDAPRYDDVVDDIRRFFEERLDYAVRQGVAEERIWLDPGFGFGKTVQHNLRLLRRLGEFKELGRPLLVGTSNKSTIGKVLDAPPGQRTEGTAATVAIAIAHGASAVRVHDVETMGRVARMSDAVMGRTDND